MTERRVDCTNMKAADNPVPERRAKSYRREHEEKRNRRLQRLHQKCTSDKCVTGDETCMYLALNRSVSVESPTDPVECNETNTELSVTMPNNEGVIFENNVNDTSPSNEDDAEIISILSGEIICNCPDVKPGFPCSECVALHERRNSKYSGNITSAKHNSIEANGSPFGVEAVNIQPKASEKMSCNLEKENISAKEASILVVENGDPIQSSNTIEETHKDGTPDVSDISLKYDVDTFVQIVCSNVAVDGQPEDKVPCSESSESVGNLEGTTENDVSSLNLVQNHNNLSSNGCKKNTEVNNSQCFPSNVVKHVVVACDSPCQTPDSELKSPGFVEDHPIPDCKIVYDIQDLHDAQEKVFEIIGQNVENEENVILSHITNVQEQLDKITKLRNFNQQVASIRPDESYFSRFDSSLKKNRAFVRKLKTFTASQLEPLLADLQSLNLTKYVSEAASALVEAKLKMSDVPYAIKLCSAIHQRYSDFSSHFLESWQRTLIIKRDDKSFNQSKLRVDLRFYADLINIGIFTHKEGLPLLGNVLTVLTAMDKEEHNNINILLTFCRYCGEAYAGLVPRKIRCLAEKYNFVVPRSTLLTKEKQKNVKSLLKEYYSSLCKHLVKEHYELQSFEKQNRKILQTKGELSAERRERKTNMEVSLQRLLAGVSGFSEILDEDMPELPEDDSVRLEGLNFKVGNSESEDGINLSSIWEDEETQLFYENLPNMKEFLPNIAIVKPSELEGKVSEEALKANLDDADDITANKEEDVEEEPVPPEPDETEEQESHTTVSNKAMLENFLSQLPHCINREMIDTFAVDFVMNLNTKFNRRKLVRTLFTVPRTRLDLLPFYARFVATLYPVMPDVATELGQFLKQDFKYHLHKKDQINIESKVKVVRFIGELVKFRMYSKIEALFCFKLLLHDFTYHHIEMCCNLLESCGRFLLRHPESHQRTKVYLEQMMRKKNVTALDLRYVTMIENAYYHVNPPETSTYIKKERPPVHEFIRKILYQDLAKANTDKILKLMRKLDWKNEELSSYAIKCLTYAFNVKYYNIRCLANLVAGLIAFQEFVGPQVVDGVMEDIRLGMEINQPKFNQRRVAMLKYIGELYNYRVVESGDVFKVLYSLITFGVSMSHYMVSPLDPPDHLFRIRLVCLLLETCGQYFNAGISKKKLDCFLVYFQNYVQFKMSHPHWSSENPFPVGIKYMYKDILLSLRPNIKIYESYEAAQTSLKEMNEEFLNLFSQKLGLKNLDINEEDEYISDEDVSDINEINEEDVSEDDHDNKTIQLSRVDQNNEDSESTEHQENDNDDDNRNNENDNYEKAENIKNNIIKEREGRRLRFTGVDDEYDSSDPNSPIHEGEIRNVDMLGLRPKCEECPEDDEFLSAFEKMVSGNMQERVNSSVKPQQVDISVPVHIKNNTKKTYEQLQQAKRESETATMNFVLLVRKGLKKQFKNLSVPLTSELALNLKDREEAERAEKQHVKRLTLDINERLEEEDYQEMLTQCQKPFSIVTNREKKQKYQHPKGAPDADAIFGGRKGS